MKAVVMRSDIYLMEMRRAVEKRGRILVYVMAAVCGKIATCRVEMRKEVEETGMILVVVMRAVLRRIAICLVAMRKEVEKTGMILVVLKRALVKVMVGLIMLSLMRLAVQLLVWARVRRLIPPFRGMLGKGGTLRRLQNC